MRQAIYEFWLRLQAFSLAIAVHLLAAMLVVLGTMDWKPFKPPDLSGLTIEAVIVDTSAILEARREAEEAQRRRDAQLKRDQDMAAQRERERQQALEDEQRRQREAVEQKRQEDLRLQQLRDRQERERQDRLRRQEDELAEIRRLREDAARQRKIEEERLKQLDDLRRRDVEARQQAEAESLLQQQRQAEAAAQQTGRLATKREAYWLAIQAHVTQNWLRPSTAKPGLRCTLKVVQIPGGEVISAAISGACNGDEATRRSLVAAVERTGALPYRDFEDVFEREIDFVFRYDGD